MAMSSGNDSGGVMADINVTPLVDVMLVLLIIFMITTPLMNNKTKVELPRAELRPEIKQADEKRNKGATPITIDWPQPRWHASSACRITVTLPVQSKV